MLDALRSDAADVLIGAMRDPVPHDDIVQEHIFDDPTVAQESLLRRLRAHAALAATPSSSPRSSAIPDCAGMTGQPVSLIPFPVGSESAEATFAWSG